MTAFLRAVGLTAGYGSVPVLHDVSIEVDLGQIVAVVGANGAGKSTLARSLTGFARVFGGTIHVGDEDVTGWSSDRRARYGIVQVPEGRRLFPRLSVMDNLELAFFGRRRVLTAQRKHALLEHVFGVFPVLEERREQSAGTLSGGQQQMLAIARALLLETRLLILDEPSTGLAPILTQRIFTVLRELVRTTGCACVLIEQRATAALGIASFGYVLERGRLAVADVSDRLLGDERLRRGYTGG